MAPITDEQVISIIRRLRFLATELEDLKAYEEMDYFQYQSDRKSRRDVERIIENLVNAALDIAKILIAGEDLEVPETYRQAFIQLGEAGIIDQELALALAEKARTRNILAHQYLDIKWERIKDFLATGIANMEQFKQQVEQRLIAREKEEKRRN
ncbi:type VII toxin-antitoxin system HepT family RNase toxin [Moorella sp. ACPs]|uniref:type VII toxin-antitoxin system HepT family RNase toxin n=1 Tax=Neomoorella carbonis TaxID=3062783 RepID=UPI00324BFE9C